LGEECEAGRGTDAARWGEDDEKWFGSGNTARRSCFGPFCFCMAHGPTLPYGGLICGRGSTAASTIGTMSHRPEVWTRVPQPDRDGDRPLQKRPKPVCCRLLGFDEIIYCTVSSSLRCTKHIWM
jgi:hypothetical protein